MGGGEGEEGRGREREGKEGAVQFRSSGRRLSLSLPPLPLPSRRGSGTRPHSPPRARDPAAPPGSAPARPRGEGAGPPLCRALIGQLPRRPRPRPFRLADLRVHPRPGPALFSFPLAARGGGEPARAALAAAPCPPRPPVHCGIVAARPGSAPSSLPLPSSFSIPRSKMAAAAAPPAPSPPPPAPAGPRCPGSWPNFAVVCSFLERYGALLDLPELPFPELERVLQPPQEPGDQGERLRHLSLPPAPGRPPEGGPGGGGGAGAVPPPPPPGPGGGAHRGRGGAWDSRGEGSPLSLLFFGGSSYLCVCVCRGESGLSPRWAREGGEGLGPPLSVPPVTPVRPFPRSLSLGSFPSSVRVGLLAASRDKPK